MSVCVRQYECQLGEHRCHPQTWLGLKARKAVFASSCLLCQRECWWEQETLARMRIWGWGRNCKVCID